MKPILTFLFLSFSVMCIAQTTTYTDAEKETFVKIYFELKENKTSAEDLLAEVLSNAKLDRDAYLALRQSKKIEDRNRLQALKNEAKKIQANHGKTLTEELCKEHAIPTSLYLDMQTRYHQEINFHEELRPFFKAYIETKK